MAAVTTALLHSVPFSLAEQVPMSDWLLATTLFLLKRKDCRLIMLHESFRIVKPTAYGFVVVVALQTVLQEILRHVHCVKSCLNSAK